MAFTSKMAYPTNLTIAQFEILDELLLKSKTRGSIVSKHLNLLQTGSRGCSKG